MNFFSLANFAAFLIYIVLILFTLSKNPKAGINLVCSLLISCFAIWSFTSVFIHASAYKNDVMLLTNINSFGWCSLPSFYLWFTFIFTKKEKILKKWYFYLIIFLIPSFFIYKQWTGYFVSDNVRQLYWWSPILSVSIWPWFYNIYYLLFIIISIYLCYSFGRKTKLIHEKKQAKIIVISSIFTFVLSTLTDVLFPLLKIHLPGMAPIIFLIWTGGIVYAITKYKLMVLTSSIAAKDILSTMNDSLILLDQEGKITEANNATFNLLNYNKNEIIGKPVDMLFALEEKPFIELLLSKKEQHQKISKNAFIENRRINYLSKTKEKVPIDFSGTIMKEKTGDIIGIVCLARDIREIIKSEKQKEKLDKLKNDFIANITHDFRSPLTAILNIADLEFHGFNIIV